MQYTGAPGTALWERVWYRPTITPIGMDVPSTTAAGNTLLAEVTTKLSCRFAPGMDPASALDALEAHLAAHAPFGAQVEMQPRPPQRRLERPSRRARRSRRPCEH